ncbi:MAG TPA: hypothetical protein VM165_15290 [Planctomycetaceae bacterium]|nr:hypothetical protein [Planctomycetaceae bacterium]
MARFRSVPLLPAVIACALLLGAMVTCRKEAADAINDNRLWTRADGLPMDHAGNLLKCYECGSPAWFQDDHHYQCENPHCRVNFEARYDSATGEIRMER